MFKIRFEKKKNRWYFLTGHCFPKCTDATERQFESAKLIYVNFKKAQKIRRYRFDQSEHGAVNSYRETVINGFKLLFDCCRLIFVNLALLEDVLTESASVCVAFAVTRNLCFVNQNCYNEHE